MKTTKIDVIIVSKNRPRSLIKCIKFLISGKIIPARIIVVDSSNNSKIQNKNSLLNLVKDITKLIYRKVDPQTNISASRNFGLNLVKAKYFAFIDDDEVVPMNWLLGALEIMETDKKIDVLCGPKIPLKDNNYWVKVWESVLKEKYDYIGPTDFVASGNSVYKTSFIMKHKIKYNETFVSSASEDSVLSYQLYKNQAKIIWHKDIFVYHQFRNTFKSFSVQWFNYGFGTAEFHLRYYINDRYQGLRMKVSTLVDLYKYSIKYNHVSYLKREVLWGNVIREFAFTFGYLSGLYKFRTPFGVVEDN